MASVSFGTALPPLPKSLSYAVSRLAGFSRRKIRMVQQSSTTSSPNGTIKVVFPAECLDLSTLTFFWKATTTTTAGKASVAHAEDLVESMYLTAGGQAITQQFAFNDIFTVFKDYQLADKTSIRKLLSSKASGAPANNLTDEPMALYSPLGFFNSVSPRVIDFSLFPLVELNLRWAGVEALIGSADAAGQSFKIEDFYIEVDALSLPDIYHQSMQSYLASGAIVEIPYTNILSFTSSAGSIDGLSQMFNVSSQSIDAVVATVYDTANRGSNVWDTVQQGNTRFARGCTDLKDINIRINNIQMNPYGAATPDRSAISCISELVGLDDTVGSSHPNLDSLDRFKTKFYAHVLRLNHRDAAYGNALISGMNTLQSPATIQINYTGTGTKTCLPVAHVLCTSSILVAQGRQVELRQ